MRLREERIRVIAATATADVLLSLMADDPDIDAEGIRILSNLLNEGIADILRTGDLYDGVGRASGPADSNPPRVVRLPLAGGSPSTVIGGSA